MHLVLFGDSAFDNGTYVRPGEPDVTRQIQDKLGPSNEVTLLAVDGARVEDIGAQLTQVPPGATHLFVSVGGNDALERLPVLLEPVNTAGQAYSRLDSIRQGFEAAYAEMIGSFLSLGLPLACCTIYYPRFTGRPLDRLEGLEAPDSELQPMAMGALAAFNDAITRQAFLAGLPLIDFRIVFDQDTDFANPIEPSAQGGNKIADRVLRVAQDSDSAEAGVSRVYR